MPYERLENELRAVRRHLRQAPLGSWEHESLEAEARHLRDEYRRLVEAARQRTQAEPHSPLKGR